MIPIALIALFAAVSPAQEIVEDVDSQEVCEEALIYEDAEFSDEVVLGDEVNTPSEEEPAFDEE